MTTVAYRDGVMAADTGITNSGGVRYASVSKMHRCPDGVLMAGAGDYGSVLDLFSWYDRGCPSDDVPEFGDDEDMVVCALVIYPDGRVAYIERDLRECPLEGEFFAIGSGVEGALAAMAAGATAEEAVEIMCGLDIYTNGPVRTERLYP